MFSLGSSCTHVPKEIRELYSKLLAKIAFMGHFY